MNIMWPPTGLAVKKDKQCNNAKYFHWALGLEPSNMVYTFDGLNIDNETEPPRVVLVSEELKLKRKQVR